MNGTNKAHLVIHRGESFLGLCEAEEFVVDALDVGYLLIDKQIRLQGSQVVLMIIVFIYNHLVDSFKYAVW